MLRSRVRRSFTVEVKSKSRQTHPWSENAAPSPVNWAALDPAPETPSPFETSWSAEPATAAPPVAAEKPRRILQNLIVPEAEPETDEPVVEREPRLPRVRRVAPARVRSEAAQAGASWSSADIQSLSGIQSSADLDDDAPEPVVRAAPPQRPAPPQAVSVTPMPAPSRKATKSRSAEPVLGPGERWKRRLPRSCR